MAFEVVDSNRRAVRPGSLAVCRKAVRETAKDMLEVYAHSRTKRKVSLGAREGGWWTIGELIEMMVRDCTFSFAHRPSSEEPR